MSPKPPGPASLLTTWDLSDLYSSPSDARIKADFANLANQARKFQRRFKGRLAQLSPPELAPALAEYERLTQDLDRSASYSGLFHALHSGDSAAGRLIRWDQEQSAAIYEHFTFVYVELTRLGRLQLAKLAKHQALSSYKHYLWQLSQIAEHVLSEPEEIIMSRKNLTSITAFSRLFTETTSQRTFPFSGRQLTQDGILANLHNTDRTVRKKAAAAFTAGLKKDLRLASYIYNTLLQDKAISDRTRNFIHSEDSRHLENEIAPPAVAALCRTVITSYPQIVQPYYRLKKALLKLDHLYDYDRYAPLPRSRTKYTYAQAKDIVSRAYSRFSPPASGHITSMFTHPWIDVYPRPGKTTGAFCHGVTPDFHPLVLLNFSGTAGDVKTLAHELGHALHDSLARTQNYFNYHPVLVLAESASTFGEMLTFESLLSAAHSPLEKLKLILGFIEDAIATIHRQPAMYMFESSVHRTYRKDGELSADHISQLWIGSQAPMFGDTLSLTPDYAVWWSYIPHIINSPFYVYAYAFGKLLALSLFQRYREQGPDFVPQLLDLLSSGGSNPPAALLEPLGIDITKTQVWQSGLAVISDYLRQAQALAKEVKLFT